MLYGTITMVIQYINIGLIAKNCNMESLRYLEPWCSTIFVDNKRLIPDYIMEEQFRTLYDLSEKIFSIDHEMANDVLVEFDAMAIDQQGLLFIQHLSKIIFSSGELGIMQHGPFLLNIRSMDTYENMNIKCKNEIIEVSEPNNVKN